MNVTLRTLTANDTEALEQVRQYFRNYAAWLGVDLSYQNFDQEMASLPGAYAEPQGRLFFAEVAGRPAGCVGVRALRPDGAERHLVFAHRVERHVHGTRLSVRPAESARPGEGPAEAGHNFGLRPQVSPFHGAAA